uniref:ATP synthase complex subunit 8 n=1 Tax=Oneirodes thompsoni TaxID=412658 RepID=D3KRT7_ONETH|nr:ATP synthase F0 subunit 8 [Oneirodes thompsoni]BAI77174.1 ATPase subunit 8 [Oneirodes thompsoni]
MPQLNPSPWLAILIFSWLILLTVLPLKLMPHTFPDAPSPEALEALMMQPWAWPWF